MKVKEVEMGIVCIMYFPTLEIRKFSYMPPHAYSLTVTAHAQIQRGVCERRKGN